MTTRILTAALLICALTAPLAAQTTAKPKAKPAVQPVVIELASDAATSAPPPSTPDSTEASPTLCSMIDSTTIYARDIGRVPNYFFRPFPTGNKVAYSSNDQNFILDLETGEELRVPRRFDAVPTPDEKWLTIPYDSKGGMIFYPMDVLLGAAGKRDSTDAEKAAFAASGATGSLPKYDPKTGGLVELEAYRDTTLNGVYQSIGGFGSRKPGEYRVITDQDKLSVRDYVDEGGTIQPKGPVQKLCAGKSLSMPMLSKDGTELSGLDTTDPNPALHTTKIWKLKDGNCVEPPEDLGFPTGKIDFSWESNDLIAFHASSHTVQLKEGESENHYVTVPSDDMAANVFVFNRKSRELFRLTNNTNSNSMYPAFKRDGRLVYLSHPNSESAAMPKFIVADHTKAKAISLDFLQKAKCDTPDESRKFHAVLALGTLWTQVCSAYAERATPSAALLFSLSLDPEQCKELVAGKWDSYRSQVIKSKTVANASKYDPKVLDELTPNDLLAACPKERPKGKVKQVFSELGNFMSKTSKPISKHAVAPSSCIACHPGHNYMDAEAMNAPSKDGTTLCQRIRDRLSRESNDPRSMPMGLKYWSKGEQDVFQKERASFEAYLLKVCK